MDSQGLLRVSLRVAGLGPAPSLLERIALRVAGLARVSKNVTIEVPYSKGTDMWKIEQKGKFPPKTKDAVLEIVRGYGGKPKYEEDGLLFDVPADKAESAAEDIENLSGIDKSFRALFDTKGLLKRTLPKVKEEKPKVQSKAEKKADKLLEKADAVEPEKSKVEPKPEKSKAEPKPGKPEKDPSRKPPQEGDDFEELADAFGVPARKKKPFRKEPETRQVRKPEGKPGKAEPAKPAPEKQQSQPPPSGRRRPGPPPKAKFLKSLDRMSQVVQQSEDQEEIVEAVEDFLDGIRYDSWPESA